MWAYTGQSVPFENYLLVAYIYDEKLWPEHEHVSKRVHSHSQLHCTMIFTLNCCTERDSFSRHNRDEYIYDEEEDDDDSRPSKYEYRVYRTVTS